MNRENRAEIVEYNPADLKECDTCGRKFNPDSIAKHRKVCKKFLFRNENNSMPKSRELSTTTKRS